MTVKEFLGVDSYDRLPDGTTLSHEEKYSRIVKMLGEEKVFRCVPFTNDELEKMFAKSQHMNEHMNIWEWASGFLTHKRHDQEEIEYVSSPLTELMVKQGIDSFSPSDCVCILKQAARMRIGKPFNA